MSTFESDMRFMGNTSKKVKLFLFLIALNLAGFAMAYTYFSKYNAAQAELVEVNQESTSFKGKVESSSRIVQFGLEVLRLLKTSE